MHVIFMQQLLTTGRAVWHLGVLEVAQHQLVQLLSRDLEVFYGNLVNYRK